MIAVGAAMPQRERTIRLTDMIVYAGATWDWHQLHYDPAYLAPRGLPAPVVDGQVFGAYLASDLEAWLGPRCFITELSFTFRNLMYAGETICIAGTVTEADEQRVCVDLTATILASEFGDERAAMAPALAVVRLDTIDGPV